MAECGAFKIVQLSILRPGRNQAPPKLYDPCSRSTGDHPSGLCPFLCPRSFKISRNLGGGMDSSSQFRSGRKRIL